MKNIRDNFCELIIDIRWIVNPDNPSRVPGFEQGIEKGRTLR